MSFGETIWIVNKCCTEIQTKGTCWKLFGEIVIINLIKNVLFKIIAKGNSIF